MPEPTARSEPKQVPASVVRQIGVGCLLSVWLITAISVVDYIPTHDGPNTILHGWLSQHLHDADKGYATYLEPSPGNVTSLAFGWIFHTLLRFMDWQDALQATLCLGALLWSWGFFCLVAVVEPRRLSLAAFGFATALCWPLYMGFFSYWLASGLGFFVLAFALAAAQWRAGRLALLAGAMLVLVAAHSFVGMLCGLLLALVVTVRSPGASRLRALLGLGLAGLPAVLLAVQSGAGSSEALVSKTIREAPLESSWLGLAELLAMPADCFVGGPGWRGALPVGLAALGLGLTLWFAVRRTVRRLDLALALAALVPCVLSFVLPFHFRLWNFFSPRFVPLWVLLGIALLPIERLQGRRLSGLLGLGSAAFAVASIGWAMLHNLALAGYDADAIALMRAPVHRTGPRLPLVLTDPHEGMAHAQPGLNLPMLFTIDQGGTVPFLFATRPGIHPHVFRAPPDELFPRHPGRFYGEAFRRAGTAPQFPPRPVQLSWLTLLGAGYEDVILVSEPDDARAFLERGYVADQQRGNAAILRYQGCGLRVAIDTADAPAVPLLVEYGWAPLVATTGQQVLAPSAAGSRVEARFAEAPCGAIWVRVSWDVDRSGSRSAGDLSCAGANALGMVEAVLGTRDQQVRCLAPAAVAPAAP